MKALCRICFRELDDKRPLISWLFDQPIICYPCQKQFVRFQKQCHDDEISVYAYYLYNDFMENLLFQYKESRDIALAPVFLNAIHQDFIDRFRHATLVPMPSSDAKTKERGFVPLLKMLENEKVAICDCLMKKGAYKQSRQRGKSRENIREMMQFKEEVPLPKGRIILFDDVLTSGNTLKTARRLFLQHGIETECVVLSIHPHFVELCDEIKL